MSLSSRSYSSGSGRPGRSLFLLHCNSSVGGQVGQNLNSATRPANLQLIDEAGLSEPEVRRQAVLGEEAGPALDLTNLPPAAGSCEREPGTDAVTIALGSNQPDLQPTLVVAGVSQ